MRIHRLFKYLIFIVLICTIPTVLISQNHGNEFKQSLKISQDQLKAGKYSEALISAQKAEHAAEGLTNIERTKSFIQIGKVYQGERSYIKAYSYFWKALFTVDPDHSFDVMEIYYGLGKILNEAELYDQSLQMLLKADEQLPNHSDAFYRIQIKHDLSEVNFYLKNYQAALVDFQSYREFAFQYQLFDDEVIAIRGLADCYIHLLHFQEAIAVEQSLIPKFKSKGLKKEVSNSLYRIAQWYLQSNQTQQALETFERELDLGANNPLDTRYQIIDCQMMLKNYNVASQRLKQLLSESSLKSNEKIYFQALNIKMLIPFLQNNIDQSLKEVKDVELLIASASDPYDKLMLVNTISNIYESAQNYPQANKYFKMQLTLNYEIESQEKAKAKQKANLEKSILAKENQIKLSQMNSKLVEEELKQINLQQANERKKWELQNLQQQQHLLEQKSTLQSQAYKNSILLEQNKSMAAKQNLTDYQGKHRSDSIQYEINKTNLEKVENEKKWFQERSQFLTQRNKTARYLFGLILVIVILLLGAYLNFRKQNRKLHHLNSALLAQKEKLESTLIELQSTQHQLIESERLASLGQLTAGIAHEIRNPLNFVTNYSGLIGELMEELKQSNDFTKIEKSEDALEILNLITENNQKVLSHGQRAARIISSMLDVSSGAVGNFDKADLNQLIEDSAKLSYQGIKGDISNFSASLDFNFDSGIKEVVIIHQDIGRVIINLVNNACQAIDEKRRKEPNFMGKIAVSTQKFAEYVEIVIQDNGNGMSQAIREKIFNPFFTTKPAGKGTGLGLTMTYDIITKKHQGKLMVESEEGVFSKFIIQIPLNLTR